jgi:O-antigen polymerase
MHIVLETPGGTGLYLSFNVFGWLIATLLISLGLWQITLNKKVVTSSLQLYSLLGFLCLCVPMFYGSEFSDHAIPRLLGLAGGLLLLFCLYQFDELKKNPQQVLWWILIAIAIQACFGLVQYFILEAGDWGGYKPEVAIPHGSFLQRNVMASFMTTGIALSIFLASYDNNIQHNAIKKWLLYCTLFCSSFLIIPLFSRTGYLTLISSILFISPYLFLQNKKQLAKLLLIITFALITAKISLENKPSSLIERKGTNVTARTDIYSITTIMILNNPFLGYGYGNFERSYLDFNNKLKLNDPEINSPLLNLSHPHNEVLYWVSEGGVIAFLGMILFFIAYMKSWLKINNKLAKRLAILGLITPLLLHSQLEFPFYSSVSHWFVFIILLWFTDMHSNSDKSEFRLDKTFLLRFLAVLTSVIFVPFLVTTLHTGMIIVDHEKNGYQNLEKLTDIVNPIAWQTRLDGNIYAHTLIAGLRKEKLPMLQRYVNWGLKRVKHTPRSSIYSNTLLSLDKLQQKLEYHRVLLEAKKTYPLIKKWGENTSIADVD